MPKEIPIKKVVTYKERDWKGDLGEIQFWEESDENLAHSISTGDGWDFKSSVQGVHLGQLRLNKKNVTPKMAKKIFKIINKALNTDPNTKVKTTFIAN